MKTLIQQTDSDGNTRFIEKVATCLPEGNVSLTDDVFDEATYEHQYVVDHMKEGKEKMEASLRFADYCIDCGVYGKALHYYSYVLEESVFDGRIKKGYKDLAFRAYQGMVCCNSCENEYTWEVSSEILEKYRELFEKDNNLSGKKKCRVSHRACWSQEYKSKTLGLRLIIADECK